ncbi:MAG: hypothetical protein HFH49_05925 [Lachnospiraceae bacterium]|nr:hypothetical protein [Lachnospiraceae bacterium]
MLSEKKANNNPDVSFEIYTAIADDVKERLEKEQDAFAGDAEIYRICEKIFGGNGRRNGRRNMPHIIQNRHFLEYIIGIRHLAAAGLQFNCLKNFRREDAYKNDHAGSKQTVYDTSQDIKRI